MANKVRIIFDAVTAGINAKMDRLRQKASGIGKEFSKSEKGIDGIVGKLGAAASATTLILNTWQKIVERQQKSADLLRSTKDVEARFLSLFGGDVRGAKEATGLVERFQVGAGTTRAEAFDVGFAAQSAGVLSDENLGNLIKLRQAGFTEIPQIIESVNDAAQTLGITFDEALTKSFVAAAKSKTSMVELAKAVGVAAPAMKELGTGADEVFSLFGAARGQAVSEVATQFKQLSLKLAGKGFKGSVTELVNKEFQGKELAQIQKILGGQATGALGALTVRRAQGDAAALRGELARSGGALVAASGTRSAVIGQEQQELATAEALLEIQRAKTGKQSVRQRARDLLQEAQALEPGFTTEDITTALPDFVSQLRDAVRLESFEQQELNSLLFETMQLFKRSLSERGLDTRQQNEPPGGTL